MHKGALGEEDAQGRLGGGSCTREAWGENDAQGSLGGRMMHKGEVGGLGVKRA